MTRERRQPAAPSESMQQGYVACAGELMWDLHTTPGASFDGDMRLAGSFAGAAANVACALSEAGMPAAMVGQIADDPLGRAACAQLAARGIDVSALHKSAGRCGLVFIEHRPEGGMRCVAYPPRYRQSVRELQLPVEGRCLALHIGALPDERPALSAHTRLARRVRKAGGWVSLDLNLRPRLWRNRQLGDRERRLLGQAHIVKASAADLKLLELSSAPGKLLPARQHLGCPDATLLVTRDERSTSASGPWGSLRRAAEPAQARNTVGAGDAFCAGVLSELRQHAGARLDRKLVVTLVHRGHAWAQRHVTRPPPGSVEVELV